MVGMWILRVTAQAMITDLQPDRPQIVAASFF